MMMDQEKIIEFLRKQIGVSYDKAKEALNATNNDLIEAIIMLKGKQAVIQDQWQVYAPDLQKRVKELVKEAQVVRITISRNGKTWLVLPAWLGVAAFVMFPIVSLLTTLGLVYNNVTLTVERLRP